MNDAQAPLDLPKYLPRFLFWPGLILACAVLGALWWLDRQRIVPPAPWNLFTSPGGWLLSVLSAYLAVALLIEYFCVSGWKRAGKGAAFLKQAGWGWQLFSRCHQDAGMPDASLDYETKLSIIRHRREEVAGRLGLRWQWYLIVCWALTLAGAWAFAFNLQRADKAALFPAIWLPCGVALGLATLFGLATLGLWLIVRAALIDWEHLARTEWHALQPDKPSRQLQAAGDESLADEPAAEEPSREDVVFVDDRGQKEPEPDYGQFEVAGHAEPRGSDSRPQQDAAETFNPWESEGPPLDRQQPTQTAAAHDDPFKFDV